MKTLLKRIWNADVRWWYLFSILFFSLILLLEYYKNSLWRLIEAVQDFCTSVIHWFLFVFEFPLARLFGEIPKVNVLFLEYPSFSFRDILGFDPSTLLECLKRFPNAYLYSFGDYNLWLFNTLYWISLYLCMLSPLLYLLYRQIKTMMLTDRYRDIGYVTKPARMMQGLVRRVLLPCRRILSSFIDFMCDHRWITYILLTVWLLNFNVLTLIVEAFAFYFYFVSSFDFVSLLMLLFKMMFDGLILLSCMPLLYWLVIACCAYYRVFERRAIDELLHMEAMNCGFLKLLDIVTLIIGEPGMGKTTLLTDFVLSWVNIYKCESLRILYRYEMMFPSFCFAKLREELISKIENHEIFCLPQVNDWVDELFEQYEKTKNKSLLFGYDEDLFRMSVDVGNRDVSLRDALKTYGRAFMIYYNNNPSLSNYSIRFDGNFDDSMYLKLWDGNFFRRKKISRFSRILDQDMLRFGKKINPDSPNVGAFGYGIYSHTELAKSVGNQNTNAQYKAEDKDSNPKNDKHSYSFMMGRHPYSTVDNFVFFRFIGDEQRASSLMAEELGLMSVLAISEKGELQIAIKGFAWLFALRERLCKSFEKFYLKRENARGDVTLTMLLLKYMISVVLLSCERLENRFGYREIELIRQKGSAFSGNSGTANTAGEVKRHIYYQMNMKDYSDRFLTDCYSKLFAEAQKACGRGILDMEEYQGLDMSVDEMNAQSDRFMMNLMKMIHGEEDFEKAVPEKKIYKNVFY